MSELRDLTQALRSFDKRLASIEDCLVVLVRDSQQQADWRHEQKNRKTVEMALEEERDRTMQQVQKACGALNYELTGINERLDAHSRTRLEDVKSLNARVGKLEESWGDKEEVTRP